MGKIDKKLKDIEERIRKHYFLPYNITFRSFSRGLAELIKKHMHKLED